MVGSLCEFLERKNILKIKKGDILYVKDLNINSKNVIDELKDKCDILIYDEGTPIQEFSCIKNNFNFMKNKYFGLIEKDILEKELSKNKKSRDYLKDILEDYKKERLKEII